MRQENSDFLFVAILDDLIDNIGGVFVHAQICKFQRQNILTEKAGLALRHLCQQDLYWKVSISIFWKLSEVLFDQECKSGDTRPLIQSCFNQANTVLVRAQLNEISFNVLKDKLGFAMVNLIDNLDERMNTVLVAC